MNRICTDIEPPRGPDREVPDIWKGLPPPRQWKQIEDDLDAGLLKPPEQVIQGLLYRGGKMLLPAPSKARKTWLLLHLAACVCGGRPWLGFETRRLPVLFLDLELLPHETPERQRAIQDAAKLWDLSDLHIQQLRGHRLSIERVKSGLLDYCRTKEIGLLIIDPWYKLSGGADEIGTEGVSELLAEIEEIAREANCAVAISHHFTKGDSSHKSVIDLASGSGVFGRDPDLICGIRELADSSEQQPLVKMEFVARSFKPVPPIGLRWQFPVWVRDDSLDLQLKTPGAPGRPASATVNDILQILGSQTLSVSDWSDLCCHQLGISDRTFKGLKAQALSKGLIETLAQGRATLCRLSHAAMPPQVSAPANPVQMRLPRQ